MRKIDGLRVGKTTPEKTLAEANLSLQTDAKELAGAARKHDTRTLRYLDKAELGLGAQDLRSRYLPESGVVHTAGFRYRSNVATGVVAARATALNGLTVKDVVAEAKTGKGDKYINRAELEKAANTLVGFSETPLADSPVKDFSVDTHVLKPNALGYEFFFGSMLQKIPKYFSDRIIRGSNATLKLAEIAKDPNTRIEQNKPNTKGYFPGDGPFIVLPDGDNEIWIEQDKWGTRVDATLVKGGEVAGTVNFHDNSWMKKHGDFSFGDKNPMADVEMRFMSYSSVAAAAAVARAVRPEDKAVYDKAEKEASAMRTEALGKYFKATGVVEKHTQLVDWIKQNGPQDLGDSDITIKISKGKLVFDNHASGAKYSVSAKALKAGRFEADCRYNGKSEGRLVIDKNGKFEDAAALGFASTISFNTSFWISELLTGNTDL